MPVDEDPINKRGNQGVSGGVEIPDRRNRIPVLAERVSTCVMDA